jgi:hypothetical protein
MSYFALWGRTLKADTPEFSTQAFSLTQPRGMEGSVLKNVLDAIMDNLE